MSNTGGPWGGGGNDNEPPKRPEPKSNNGGTRGQDTDIDRILSEGQAQLRKLMGGGRGGNTNGNKGGRSDGPKPGFVIGALLAIFALFVGYKSIYFLESGENALVLRLGQHVSTRDGRLDDEAGLNFALWPIYTVEKLQVTEFNTETVGAGTSDITNYSLMLTSDENIVDIKFDVVWRIKNPADYQFNLVGQKRTIVAVAQSTIREVVAQQPLIPILNTERENISATVKSEIQENLDRYNAGIEIVRVNLTQADPPRLGPDLDVVRAFERVQEAEQTRDQLQSEAQANANRVLAAARGTRSRLLEEAEAYRALTINDAEGEASRFTSVLQEYKNAPDVTRRRLYLETIEEIYRGTDKIFIDEAEGGSGIVPYLPLNELNKSKPAANAASTGAN